MKKLFLFGQWCSEQKSPFRKQTGRVIEKITGAYAEKLSQELSPETEREIEKRKEQIFEQIMEKNGKRNH